MRGILQSATALAALVATAPAFATEGWYGRFDLGYSFDASGDQSRVDLPDVVQFPPGTPVEAPLLSLDRFIPDSGDFDENGVQSISVGYAFLNSGFRAEIEFAHRYNESDEGFVAFFDPDPFFVDPIATAAGPKLHAWSYMLNAYYDFNKDGDWSPYLGAGIGADQLVVSEGGSVANIVNLDTGRAVSTSSFRVDDNDWTLAWQLMAGVAFRASDRLMIDVGYRYHQADEARFSGVVLPTLGVAPPQFFSKDLDYDQSAVLVGLRWQFLAPAPPPPPYTPPPPPPPPPACPAEQFTADRGKDLAAAMDEAAAQSRTCNYSAVTVSGPDSQMATVRDGLVQRGVPASIINTQPSGAATGPVTITLN